METAGYTVVSGSKPFLNETNANLTVARVTSKLKDSVATRTVKIAGKSAIVTPQNKLPKNSEMTLIVPAVAKVKTIIACINLLKLFVFPKNLG